MSDRPAAMLGDYVDLRFMPGLKSARVFIDIPIEEANRFLKMFNAPDRAAPVKVAIARMAEKAVEEEGAHAPEDARQGRGWDTMRRSAKAAVKLTDKAFKAWLVDTYWTGKEEVGDYDGLLKRALGITSKKELDVDGPKAVAFDRMLASFDYRDRA